MPRGPPERGPGASPERAPRGRPSRGTPPWDAAGFVHFEGGATMTVEAAWLGHQVEKKDLSCQVFGLGGGQPIPAGRRKVSYQ